MNLESFKFLIQGIKDTEEKWQKFYNLGLDITEISDPYYKVISHLLKVYYSEDGEDWISWYLHERRDNEDVQAWDADNNPICYSVESLWDHVEKIRVSKDFEEYSPKPEMSDKEREKLIENIFKNFGENGI
jgi:hypothetical protein